MIGLDLAALALGIVLLFIVPWMSIPVGLMGLTLVAIYVVGGARRPVARDGHESA